MMRATIPGDELLKKTHSVGQYYGFVPLAALASEMRGMPRVEEGPKGAGPLEPLDTVGTAVASFLAQCRQARIVRPGTRPLFIWHTNQAPGRAAPKRAVVQFHAIGSERALGEAVLIRALVALTRDLYRVEPVVRINSMGDRETRARYLRELTSFFKRRGATLPEECLVAARTDAFAAAELAISRNYAESLPVPTEHLSDASRRRFEDLLEYLEATETPYELARDLITRGAHWSDTCFEILAGDKRVAWGSRYNELARQVLGAPLAGIGAALFFDTTSAGVLTAPATPRSRIVFVHIGDEAKRYSIQLAEEFRAARLPLTQEIGVESLTEQMRLAESKNPAYLMVMGRKEALEGTVLLRNRQTQEERILPILGLSNRLKALA